ncbi:class I SAM-dependent methyltransferase [Patescibacteria group bacterium]|nr:class I SAM-dependent methyltransferase [Patescibacteria group bacterium]
MERITLTTKPSDGYALLDSGGEEKLERYGNMVLARPDPQALWPKNLPEWNHRQERDPTLGGGWDTADAQYVREGNSGHWVGNIPKEWPIEFGGLRFLIRPTSFKHTGLFPEQLPNWEWLSKLVVSVLALNAGEETEPPAKRVIGSEAAFSASTSASDRLVSVLNLFAYTGGATLAAAKAGASVVHVDASKTAVAWARENAAASGLASKPIRWLVEDVLVFVRREIKRGNRYDIIIMDPPSFGHGPKDELWKIEEHLIPLVKECAELLSEKPLGFLINGYAAGYSPLAFAYNLEPLLKKYGGTIQYGDLTIEEQARSTHSGQGSERLLPCGIFARWQA